MAVVGTCRTDTPGAGHQVFLAALYSMTDTGIIAQELCSFDLARDPCLPTRDEAFTRGQHQPQVSESTMNPAWGVVLNATWSRVALLRRKCELVPIGARVAHGSEPGSFISRVAAKMPVTGRS
jgi:hypothetical protein